MAKKKDDDDLNPYEKAIRNAKELSKILSEQGDILNNNRGILDSIAEVFNIKSRDFAARIRRTADQTKELQEAIRDSNFNLHANINTSFGEIKESLYKKNGALIKSITKGLDDLSKVNYDLAAGLTEALNEGDLAKFWNDFGEEGMKSFQKLVEDKKGFKSFRKFVTDDAIQGWKLQQGEINKMAVSLQSANEEVLSFRKTIATIGEYFTRDFMPKMIFDKLYDFDQILNDTQREFGLDMDQNKAKFSELVGQTAIFGLSTKETGQMMGRLGENLRTTNWDLLGTAAKDMAAISKSTGLSVDETTDLGTQMMFYGRTSKDVAKFTEQTMQMAQKYGLNAKKVLQDFTKALPTMRALGWQGGEKALRDMVLQAQKLGQNMDDLTASAKKLRTLEGSIEASADLALVGVNTNAIQMLAAARRGGKEFSSFIGDLTRGIGQIKKDGSVEFDPIDIDRLNVISESIGIPLEKLQDQVALTAQRNAKVDLFPSSMFNSLKPEEQEFLLNAARIGENGTLKLDASILGTDDLGKVSSSLISGAMSQKKSMEEQAKENTSFKESVTNLKQSIYNIFTHLQPIIEKVTDLVTGFNTWLNGFSETTKKWIAAGVLFSAVIFSVAKNWMAGYWQGLGFNAGVNRGGIFSSFGKMLGDKLKGIGNLFKGGGGGTAPIGPPPAPPMVPPGAGRGVGSFAEALKAMPSPAQLLSLAAAIAALGVAFVGIGYGIKLASEGLSELVKSFDGIANAGAALGGVVAVMGSFVGMLAIMIPLVSALSAAGTAGAIGLLSLGASFLGIGYGIKLASDGLSNLIKSFDGITNSLSALGGIVAVMGGFVGMLYAMTPAIAALSTVSTVGVVGLLALGAAFVGIGYGIKLASDGLSNLVKSFSEITNAGTALGGVVAVMGGFVGMLYAMTPAIAALSTVSTVGVVGLLALGATFIGIGYGIKLASDGLSNLVKSFGEIINAGTALGGIVAVMGGFVGMLYAMTPAIAALSTVSAIGVVGLLALGATFVGIGYGIKLASDGFSNLVKSFDSITNSLSALGGVVAVMGGFVGMLYAMTPAIAALSTISAVGAVGLLALGIAFTGIGSGIKLTSDGLSNLVKSFDGITNSLSALGGIVVTMGGFVGILYAMAPAIVTLSTVGTAGAIGLLALGVAFTGIGYGIKLASDGLSNLVKSFDEIINAGTALGSVVAVMGGFVGILYAMTPAITALSTAGTIGAVGLLTLGAAFVGMGYGIKLASDGLSNLVTSFGTLKEGSSALWSIVTVMGSFVAVSALLIPGLTALGATLAVFGTVGWAAVPPMLALGAAGVALGYGIKLVGEGISYVMKSFGEFATSILNTANSAPQLEMMSGSLLSLAPALLAFGVVGLISTPGILALSLAFGVLAPSVAIVAPALEKLSNINSDALFNIGKSFSELSLGLIALSGVGALFPLIALASGAIGLLAPALNLFAPAIDILSKINTGILLNVSSALSSFVPSLIKFSLLGILSAPIILGATALTFVGKSMMAAAPGFLEMSNINWSNIDKIGNSIGNLLPNLIGFGLKSIIAAPGIYLMNSTINSLANTMERLVNPLDLATESLGNMSENIIRLKSAIQGLDTSKLNNLADFSDRFVNASSSVTITKNSEPTESKPVKITLEPISIDLKLNGKQVQEIIIKDTAYHT